MPIVLERNLLAKLKEKGYSTYKLRKDKILSESTIQRMRDGKLLSWNDLDTVCGLLDCQPGDLIEYIPHEVYLRIVDLTEQEEENLTEYYEDQWRSPVSEELTEDYVDKLETELRDTIIPELDDEELSSMLMDVLFDNWGQTLNMDDETWDELADKYGEYDAERIQDFYQPYIDEFNEYLENEHEKYVTESVKEDLESEREQIENDAYAEFLPDDDYPDDEE